MHFFFVNWSNRLLWTPSEIRTKFIFFYFKKDDDNDNHDHAFKLKPTKNGNSVSDINFSIENINNSGYNSPTNSKNVKAKISAQTVNNLAKKIISHNNSILPVGSIAASSSSAVSSASSLATSLTKLNFK